MLNGGGVEADCDNEILPDADPTFDGIPNE